jgi:hypothetical protein
MQVRGGLVPFRLAETDDHCVGTNLLDELCADSLHGTFLVLLTHLWSPIPVLPVFSSEKTSLHVADGRRFVTLAEMETSSVFTRPDRYRKWPAFAD